MKNPYCLTMIILSAIGLGFSLTSALAFYFSDTAKKTVTFTVTGSIITFWIMLSIFFAISLIIFFVDLRKREREHYSNHRGKKVL